MKRKEVIKKVKLENGEEVNLVKKPLKRKKEKVLENQSCKDS